MAGGETIQIRLQTTADIQDVIAKAKSIQQVLDKLSLPQSMKTQFTKMFADLEKSGNAAARALESGFKTKGQVTGYAKGVEGLSRSLEDIHKAMESIDADTLHEAFGNAANDTQVKQLTQQITQLQQELAKIKADGLERLQSAFAKMKGVSDAKSVDRFNEAIREGRYDDAAKALANLDRGLALVERRYGKDSTEVANYRTALEGLKSVYEDVSGSSDKYLEIQQKLGDLGSQRESRIADALKEEDAEFKEVTKSAGQLSQSVNGVKDAEIGAAEGAFELSKTLDQFKNKITYFFGMQNAVRLFHRALKSAYDTIKDLDKVMTETAVVTEFSVGDMWSQLPEYTQRANELGVSIHDAYEAATLYYQQGLNTNQVMAVSNETLKMARIAGLDAAEATDRMTNAMRGFNMEITEANAQNVNDVYSNLAAKTASNVDEISTAMTKVASLAHNANMSFENTGAFLAQIIETTRESAETAGTALKTIIARFSEVKELYSTGELLGTDEEGNEIDVNKVSKALRTAGIDLNEYLTGAKGLDDIFMELSERWDSLDQVQQRYIATMAAGSRQQSRFIALMQDHARMTELVSYANNAAGASQGQFEKTLESLQSKLERLRTAWNELVMGIMNSDIVKWAIDRITDLIGWINKLTNSSSGLLSSISKIAAAVIGFAGARFAVKGQTLVGGITKALGLVTKEASKKGGDAATTFLTGFKKMFGKGEGSLKEKLNGFFTIDSAVTTQATAASTTVASAQTIQAQATNEATNAFSKQKVEADSDANALDKNANSANKVAQEQGNAKDATTQNTEATTKQVDKLKVAGLAATALGVAFIGIGKGFKDAGMDKAGNVLTAIGTALSAVGTVAMTIGPIFTALGIKINLAGAVAQAGWWPLIAIFAAVAVAIGGIAIAAAAIETPEEKLKRLEKQTEKAKDAADEAKKSYDELMSDFDTHDELVDELDELTKGTQAWKEKLDEVNQSVSDLIQKYPELAKYITLGDNGQLLIDQKAIDDIKKDAKDRAENASAAATYSQIQAAQQKLDMAREKGPKKSGGQQNYQYADGTHNFNLDGSGIYSTEVDLADYNREIKGLQAEVDGAILTLVSNAVDEKVKNSEYSDAIIKSLSKSGIDRNNEEVQNKFNELWEEVDGSYDAAYEKLLGEVPEGLNKAEKESAIYGALIKETISEHGSQLLEDVGNKTKEQIDAMFMDLNPENILDKTQADWKAMSMDVRADTREAVEEVIRGVKENIQENLAKIGAIDHHSDRLLQGLTYGSQEALSQQMVAMYERGGAAGTKGLNSILKSAQNNLSTKEYEAFVKALNGLELSNASDIEDLSDDLEKLGITSDDLGVDIENVEDQLKEASLAADNFDLSNVMDQLKSGLDLADKIRGKSDNAFSPEEYDELIANGIDSSLFAFDGQNYQYLGSSMTELANALEQNTEAQLETSRQELENQIAEGEYIQGLIEKGIIDEQGNFKPGQQQAFMNSGAMLGGERVAGMDENRFATALANAMQNYFNLESNKKTYEDTKLDSNAVALRNGATQGLKAEDIKSVAEEMKRLNKIVNENGDANYEYARSVLRCKQGLESLNDIQEDVIKYAKEGIKTTDLTSDSYKTMKKAISDVLDTDIELSDEWFQDANNLKLVENAMKGVDGSLEELRQSALQEIVPQIDLSGFGMAETVAEAFRTDILNIANNMPDLEVGAVWDDAAGRAALQKIQSYIGDTAEAANEYNRVVGEMTGIKIGYKEYKVSLPTTEAITERLNAYYDAQVGKVHQWSGKENQRETKVFKIPYLYKSGGSNLGKITYNDKNTDNTKNKTGKTTNNNNTKKQKWENPYDKLYNTLEKISELQRRRNNLEEDYEKAIQSESKSFKQIQNLRKKELANLYDQKAAQQELQKGRKSQINSLKNQKFTNSEGKTSTFEKLGVTKYASYDFQTNQITIDWAGINKVTDADKGAAIEAYISELEKLVDSYEDTQQELRNIDASIQEVYDRNKEVYLDFENEIYEALVAQRQAEIDNFSALSEVIASQNSKVLDRMREEIDTQRQIVENTKKENDIADKEARLAYLQRDTSGANQTEILKLQKEISNARDSYTNELIDQKISDLENDNQKAEEQRQQQIDIMQAQLDLQAASGFFWPAVYELIENSLSDKGQLKENSQLVQLLKDTGAFSGMSEFAQIDWMNALITKWKQALEGRDGWKGIQYATGGLNTVTGPAWLDGTKSKPELVLNAQDTQNFIALKDILARISQGSALNSNTFGNTYFDIDINADIGSDYDVDQLAARIKAQIARDGQYRNVNNIGFLR